jgi:hypothetical protein
MANARILHRLTLPIKAHPTHIHLQSVTGVSRYGHTGLFCTPSQLVDISLQSRFSSVVGYTRPEIEAFGPHLAALAAKEGLPDREELWRKITGWYGGYNWGEPSPSSTRGALATS